VAAARLKKPKPTKCAWRYSLIILRSRTTSWTLTGDHPNPFEPEVFVYPVMQIPFGPEKLAHHLRLTLIVSPVGHFPIAIRLDDVVLNATDKQCVGR
jgi:hypothetical protein